MAWFNRIAYFRLLLFTKPNGLSYGRTFTLVIQLTLFLVFFFGE
jgi:hypothetical protein